MPIFTQRTEVDGIFDAVDSLLEGNGKSESNNLPLVVTNGAGSLFIAITDLGAPQLGPVNVSTRLVDPNGHVRDDLAVKGPEGQLIYTVADPSPGKWTVELRSGPDSRAEIKGVVTQRDAPAKLQQLGPYLRCKTCKMALKALAWALFAYCAPFVGSALGLSVVIAQTGAIASGILDTIAKTIGVTRAILNGALGAMKDYADDPIDRLLERCCTAARLCGA